MSRIADLNESALTAEQRRVFDLIVAGPRRSVRGPLRVWLRSPQLAEHAQALGVYCRYHSSLAPRLSELAILVTAAHWQADFEWQAHVPFALRAGLSPATLEGLRSGSPSFERADETAVYKLAAELLETRRVADATYELARAALGVEALVDLIGILGYYALISMTIKAFDLAAEAPA